MRSRQNSQIANETVAIDTLLVDQTRDVVAVAIDQATDVVSGIGVDRDPQIAVEKCMLDVIHPNGWSPACGVPYTFNLDNSVGGPRVSQVAETLGASVIRDPFRLHRRRVERSLAMLAQNLVTLPPVKQFWDRQLHCDCIQWALITNNSFRLGLGTTSEQAWLSASRRYAVSLPPAALVAEGPRMIRTKVDAKGFVEIEGETYADERIPIVANRAGDVVWIDAIVFADDNSKVWVINIGGRAFPAFRRRIEPIGPAARITDRKNKNFSDATEGWSVEDAPTPIDWEDEPPEFPGRSPKSPHPQWVHDLMDEVIEKEWLIPQRPSASFVFYIFLSELHYQAKQRGCAVPAVSLSFLHRKIRRLDPYTVSRYRHGLAAARRKFLSRRPTVGSAR